MRADQIMNEYYEVLNRNQEQLKKIQNDEIYSEQWKLTEMEKVNKQVAAEQLKFKQKYELSIQNELQELKQNIFKEIPDVLTLDMDFTRDELKLLAEQHSDNYFAMRKIQDIANKNDYIIEVEMHDHMKDIKQLENAQQTIDKRFGPDPFKDTFESRLRAAAGLD